MALALATFARDEGIDVPHRAVVVVDRAGWHIAGDLRLPEGSDLVFLPAASPERQPAERLWTLVDEPIVNRAFPTLDALETVLVERCQRLEADPQRLKAHTHFHWWPADASPGLVQSPFPAALGCPRRHSIMPRWRAEWDSCPAMDVPNGDDPPSASVTVRRISSSPTAARA